MTYKEAYDKVIDAYFKNEINPLEWEFCFCGSLCDNSMQWDCLTENQSYKGYSRDEYKRMEAALLNTMTFITTGFLWTDQWYDGMGDQMLHHPLYEDALFAGMCAALEVLREIHRSRGEQVYEFVFEKRIKKEMV